ncbi:MAG TPA: hypothetical protein VGB75_00950, partial [Jatrophihabitans sp.]|uniref:hypothetical protein n=1 Tax=Jatrophihabitans sp. TaxID=1932789 RepID=UPI002EE7CB34
PLRHYAFDYWLPLPSQLIALVLRYRPGLPAALELNVALVVLMCAGAYAMARALSASPWVPALSAAVTLVQPVISAYVLQAESAVYLGAFALPAMAAAVYARRWIVLWPVAGVLAAFAAQSRTEGLVLCAVLGVAALAWNERNRWFVRAGLLLAGYLVVSAPYLLTNLSHFGTPIPPASASFPFITSYEDLFSLHVPHTWDALLGSGLQTFFLSRARAVASLLVTAFRTLDPVTAVLGLLMIGGALFGGGRGGVSKFRSGVLEVLRSDWLVPAGFLVAAFGSQVLVAPAWSGTAIVKLMVTGAPIVVVAALVQLGRGVVTTRLTLACCLALLVFPLLSVASLSRATVRNNNGVGQRVATLVEPLQAEQACLNRPLVLMTRQPWEDNQGTGFATVMIPHGSLAEILDTALKYGATDIENPAVRLDERTMAAALADGGPFLRSAAFGSRKIYRIRATTGGARC